MKTWLTLLIAACSILPGCERAGDDSPIVVSMINGRVALVDPNAQSLSPSSALLLQSVAQGLVRTDASGQIIPGIAVRWAVSDDGLYYTFRLQEGIKAVAVAKRLRQSLSRGSRNPMRSLRRNIATIVAVTPEVIELRLRSPQPDLLTMLALPEMAILLDGKGTGPMIAESDGDGLFKLRHPPQVDDADLETVNPPLPPIELRGERSARAIARFASGHSRLVLGGGFVDYPFLAIAAVDRRAIRLDPVTGMFGLRIARAQGLLGSPEMRQALSVALDRQALGAALGLPNWHPVATLLPPALSRFTPPPQPLWQLALNRTGNDAAALQSRRNLAARSIDAWRAANPQIPREPLRLWLPDGPGGRILYRNIALQWGLIGVAVERSDNDRDADLVLIDRIAPDNGPDWYFTQLSCAQMTPCSEVADKLANAARHIHDPKARAAGLADAETRLAAMTPFIPIAAPIRWSLVHPSLAGFQENASNNHPLDQLIEPQR